MSLKTIASRSNRRLGQYTPEVSKLPTLLGSRTNGRNSHTFLSNKGFTEDDSTRGPEALALRNGFPAQKGCVWDATRSEKSVCKGEDLLKHIHHIKVTNEAEKGRSLTEVCRISMRTRDFLAQSLQWLDSAMAHLELKAKASGRVTEQEFVEILHPFTEGVLSIEERSMLFSRLDGENKGFVRLELTESQHKKFEELQKTRKPVENVIRMQHAISLMQSHTADAKDSVMQSHAADAKDSGIKLSQQSQMEPIKEDCAREAPLPQAQTVAEAHEDQVVASGIPASPRQSEVSSSTVELPAKTEVMTTDDAELQELEGRLLELRSMQEERMRRRRKRELEAEIEALQRELEAKTPKASIPQAAESSPSCKSKVSFALPSTLAES